MLLFRANFRANFIFLSYNLFNLMKYKVKLNLFYKSRKNSFFGNLSQMRVSWLNKKFSPILYTLCRAVKILSKTKKIKNRKSTNFYRFETPSVTLKSMNRNFSKILGIFESLSQSNRRKILGEDLVLLIFLSKVWIIIIIF